MRRIDPDLNEKKTSVRFLHTRDTVILRWNMHNVCENTESDIQVHSIYSRPPALTPHVHDPEQTEGEIKERSEEAEEEANESLDDRGHAGER